MTTTAPPVGPRVIALSHYAGRALLESVLTHYDMTFQQSVTLRPLAIADAPVERDRLVGQVVDSLKVDAADIHGTVEELIAKGLVTEEASLLRVTDAGRKLYDDAGAETGKFSARIYAGIPAEDLAVTGRVLALITERANAELAALSA
jgi:DNA-binding MarR family transcriptional regulator